MSANTVNVLAVGDIFLADSPLKIGMGVKSSIKKKGDDYYINRIKDITRSYDICFGNLENVLSNRNYNKYNISTVEIRGEPEFVKILIKTGFNIVNVANNHMFQHGLDAYLDTLNILKDNGIKVIGDEYKNGNFEVFNFGDVKVGFVGYSMHYEQYRPNEVPPYALRMKYADIINDIKKLKSNYEGILICSLHWGYEFLDNISIEQREFCHELIDAGISIILGHHPHVPQGIEEYHSGLIVYSLGNFIFDMDTSIAKKSYAVNIQIDKNGICGKYIIPLLIHNDFCPYKMDEESTKEFDKYLSDINRKIEYGLCLNDNDMEILQRSTYNKIKYDNYRNFIGHMYRMNPYYSLSIVVRALLRRAGILADP